MCTSCYSSVSTQYSIAGGGIVTAQPFSHFSLNIQVDYNDPLKTIKNAAELTSSVMNSVRTQRTTRCCQPNTVCPSLISWRLSCCTQLINEEEPSLVLKSYLNQLRENYGPIVLGLAMQYTQFSMYDIIANGRELSAFEKSELKNCCLLAQKLLSQLVHAGLQKDLFELIDNPDSLPRPRNIEISYVKNAVIWFHLQHTAKPKGTILISSPAIQTTPKTLFSCVINYDKIEQQLAALPIVFLFQQETTGLLGIEGAKKAIQILKNILYQITNRNTKLYCSEGFALSISEERLIALIALCLIGGLNVAPLSLRYEYPCDLRALRELSEMLHAHQEELEEFNFTHDAQFDDIDGPTIPMLFFSKKQQEALLQAVEQTQSLFSGYHYID